MVRLVQPRACDTLHAFLATTFAHSLVSSGKLVSTRRLDAPPRGLGDTALAIANGVWFEHEPIAIPSFAFEWSPRMLHAAATLTLSMAIDATEQGFGLKDATPDNVLFRGATAVFVDVLSFERRDPHDPTWLPYAQFVRTFLLPLLVSREIGLPLTDLLTMRRDGLEPGEVYKWCAWSQRLLPPFLSLVTLPTWLNARAERTAALCTNRGTNRMPRKPNSS